MRYFYDNNQLFGAFKIGGISYPANWLQFATDEEKLAIGIITLQDETPTEPQPQYKTQFTSLEFLDRFTTDEQLAIVTATMASAQVKLWYDKMLGASFVDLNDARVAVGIDALIGAGLLASPRKSAILAPELITMV